MFQNVEHLAICTKIVHKLTEIAKITWEKNNYLGY